MEATRTAKLDLAGLDDGELLAMARRRDPAAFEAIIQRHNRRLYRVARGVLGGDGEVDDVVQEAYLRAFTHLDGFRGESSLSTWLTRIALNEALGRVRRRRAAVDLSTLAANEDGEAHLLTFPAASPSNPEAEAGRGQIRRCLERAVDELPEVFRMVFVMRDVEDMSIEETAAHLGIRPETVKTRLHRARRLLRKTLQKEIASALIDVFPFAGTRCARMTERVLAQLDPKWLDKPAPAADGSRTAQTSSM